MILAGVDAVLAQLPEKRIGKLLAVIKTLVL
jgi:hypothetical protein